MPEVVLVGCTPEPLMGYLKALGVFRLVAEQVDPAAQGCWRDGAFVLQSQFDQDGLRDFLLNHFRPTPIIGPWGARSGFYPGSSESSARQALDAIATSTDLRLAPFRDTIIGVRQILDRLGIQTKEDLDEGENYIRLLRFLRNELPDNGPVDAIGAWLDAVYVLTNDDRKFPPLLGTGGNEGSGSYMSNFCQVVASLLIDRSADAGVPAALFGTPEAVRVRVTVGHFDPGAIGGPNSSVGFGGGGGANPWDFLLAIEGTLLFAGAVARRMGTDTDGKAGFPFTVDPTPAGYGSAAEAEDVRAEMWMPEWDNPTTLNELKHFFAEGRAQLGRRQARTAIDFARAAVTLGGSRGLAAFHRYSVAQRNGLSYFAAYLGRFPVREIPAARLLDQLDPWLAPLRWVAGSDNAPPRFAAAVRRIDAAMLDVCRYGADPDCMQAVLRAAGRAEAELANGVKVRAKFPELRPIARLSADWLQKCDDGSEEFRLAVALAFLPGIKNRHRRFRMYVEPVVPLGSHRWKFDDNARGVVWSSTDLPTNLGAVLVRRLRDASGEGVADADGAGERQRHPLCVPSRFRPRLSDVLAFLGGRTDDQKLAELLWVLPAVSSKALKFRFRNPGPAPAPHVPAEYAVLKLVFLDGPAVRPGTTTEISIQNEMPVLGLLRAGRLDEAVEVACRRLQVSGFPTYLAGPVAGRVKRVGGFPNDPNHARRLLAALLFPLGDKPVNRLLELTVRELEIPTP